MSTPTFNWPSAFLRLGLLLTGLGVVPALVQAWLFPDGSRILTGLLLVSVAPLGALMLAIAVILFLVAMIRRR